MFLEFSVGIGRLTNVAHNWNIFIISTLPFYLLILHITKYLQI